MTDDADRVRYRVDAARRFRERRIANHPDGKLCDPDPCVACAPLVEASAKGLVEAVQILVDGSTPWQLRRLRFYMSISHPVWTVKNWRMLRQAASHDEDTQ